MNRVKLLLGKSILEALNNDGQVQILQVSRMEGEVIDKVPRIEEYGRTTRPPNDSQVVLGCIGGNSDQPIALVVGHSAARPKDGEEGDIIDWDVHGNKVHFKNTGILITAANGATVEIKQDGKIILNGGTLDVARKTDAISSGTLPSVEDFWAWINAADAVLKAAATAAGLQWPFTQAPTGLEGEITEGNDTIKG